MTEMSNTWGHKFKVRGRKKKKEMCVVRFFKTELQMVDVDADKMVALIIPRDSYPNMQEMKYSCGADLIFIPPST